MSNYDDMASTAAFLAGRDTARGMRGSAGADDAERYCPRAMHPDDEQAWQRGWRSAWD